MRHRSPARATQKFSYSPDECGDGDEAVTNVGKLQPAVVVMDITMKKRWMELGQLG
jgi:CheY-like chemotaxis protein